MWINKTNWFLIKWQQLTKTLSPHLKSSKISEIGKSWGGFYFRSPFPWKFTAGGDIVNTQNTHQKRHFRSRPHHPITHDNPMSWWPLKIRLGGWIVLPSMTDFDNPLKWVIKTPTSKWAVSVQLHPPKQCYWRESTPLNLTKTRFLGLKTTLLQ